MKSVVFKINGMRCDGCARTIKTLIEHEPGVQIADVSLNKGEARVLFNPQTIGEDQLVATIERPGFRVVGRG